MRDVTVDALVSFCLTDRFVSTSWYNFIPLSKDSSKAKMSLRGLKWVMKVSEAKIISLVCCSNLGDPVYWSRNKVYANIYKIHIRYFFYKTKIKQVTNSLNHPVNYSIVLSLTRLFWQIKGGSIYQFVALEIVFCSPCIPYIVEMSRYRKIKAFIRGMCCPEGINL